jgi:hypothetical protein
MNGSSSDDRKGRCPDGMCGVDREWHHPCSSNLCNLYNNINILPDRAMPVQSGLKNARVTGKTQSLTIMLIELIK